MAQSDYSDPDKALGPLVSFQAALQKKLRPSARLPLLRTPHSYSEEWSLGAPIATVVANLKEGMDKVNSIEALKDGFLYQVDDATASSDGKTGFLQVSVLTKSRWLDVIEVKLREEEGDKCSASVSSVSTGLLPLTVPGAPLVNIVACWFPFSDLSVGQTKTLPDVRKALGVNIKVTASSRII